MKDTILSIHNNPFAFEIKYLNTRIAFTKKFPYGIHFYVNEIEKTIVIIAILHTKQNIENIKNRL